jgi:hypothetical protein
MTPNHPPGSGPGQDRDHAGQRTCPACGSSLAPQAVICSYCGSSTFPVALSGSQREELRAFAKGLNSCLEARRNLTARKFRGLFWISIILILLLGLILRFAFLVPLVWVFLTVISCTTISFIIIRTIFQTRLASTLIQIFLQDLEPQIAAFNQEKSIPRWQFDSMTVGALEKAAPLRFFLNAKSPRRKRL